MYLAGENLAERPIVRSAMAIWAFGSVIAAFYHCRSVHIRDTLALFNYVANVGLAIIMFALIYLAAGKYTEIPADVKVVSQPSEALYFSIVTFTTLGYGDFQPAPSVRLLASLQAVLGYIALGFGIAVFTDWMSNNTAQVEKRWGFTSLPKIFG